MDDDFLACERIDEFRSICVSALSRKTVKELEVEGFGQNGFFIYEMDERPIFGGLNILAKVVSLDAAYRFIELWRGSRKAA